MINRSYYTLFSALCAFFGFVCFIYSSPVIPEIESLEISEVSFQSEKTLPYLSKHYLSTKPVKHEDGIKLGDLMQESSKPEAILKIVDSFVATQKGIKAGKTDSFLVAKGGKLLLESYFRKGRINYPHYQMSITKSYTTLALGRAMQLGYLSMKELNKPIHQFLKDVEVDQFATGASSITLHDALCMTSGIRIPKDRANARYIIKNALKGQGHAQAIFEITEAVDSTKGQYKYQSADTALVMQVIESVVPGGAEKFIREELFAPLGIDFYVWQEDLSGLPKAAAGSSLRSRDMLKVGQLVLNQGRWKGEQFIPADFIDRATSPLVKTKGNAHYGYFWWYESYEVSGKTYLSKQGRGAGGQFIIILPDIDVVAVITSHNKGMGGMLNQVCTALITAFSKQ